MKLTILGCGSMATGLLQGFVRKSQINHNLISHVKACVRSQTSASRLHRDFQMYGDFIQPVVKANVEAVTSADIVLLAHKPYQLSQVLGEDGMGAALRNKKIISMLAGISTSRIRDLITQSSADSSNDNLDIIRVMPNIGARLGESMTLISDPCESSLELVKYTTDLFTEIGSVAQVTEETYDVASVLTGAVYALTTVGIEGMLEGSTQQGLARGVGTQVVAQCLKGLARMLEQGEHPAMIRESISSPGGMTITGIVELNQYLVRSAHANAIIKATMHAQKMGSRQD